MKYFCFSYFCNGILSHQSIPSKFTFLVATALLAKFMLNNQRRHCVWFIVYSCTVHLVFLYHFWRHKLWFQSIGVWFLAVSSTHIFMAFWMLVFCVRYDSKLVGICIEIAMQTKTQFFIALHSTSGVRGWLSFGSLGVVVEQILRWFV